MGRRSKPHLDGTTWRFRYRGKTYRATTADEADLMLAKLRVSAGEPMPAPLTVAEMLERYQTEHGSEWESEMMDEFAAFCAARRRVNLAALPSSLLVAYRDYLSKRKHTRTGKPLSVKTVRTKVQIARRLLRHGRSNGWIRTRFVRPRLRKPAWRPRSLTRVELAALLRSLRASVKLRFLVPLIRIGLATGIRPGLLRKLEWSEIDFGRGVVVFPEHKAVWMTGKPLVVPLSPKAAAILSRVQVRHEAFVFVTNRNRGEGYEPYTKHGLAAILRRRGIGPYRLRHTFAQSAIDQGIQPKVVSMLMGHSDSSVVWNYARISDSTLRAAADSLRAPSQVRPARAVPSPKAGDKPKASRSGPKGSRGKRATRDASQPDRRRHGAAAAPSASRRESGRARKRA